MAANHVCSSVKDGQLMLRGESLLGRINANRWLVLYFVSRGI